MKSERSSMAILALLCGMAFLWFFTAWLLREPKAIYALAPYEQAEPLAIAQERQGQYVTYSGTLPLLSGCHGVSTGIQAQGTSTPRVTLMLQVLEPATPCDVVEPAPYEFSASFFSHNAKDATLERVTINNLPATYRVVESE